jgi:hypothetical protein
LVLDDYGKGFIQTWKESARYYLVEYRVLGPIRHYRARVLGKRHVLELFLMFLAGDLSYQSRIAWEDVTESFLAQPRDDEIEDDGLGFVRLDPVVWATKLAEEMASVLRKGRFGGTFTLRSLASLDRLIAEQGDDVDEPGTLLAPGDLPEDRRTPVRLWSLGCYLGETLRRIYGGTWEVHPDFPRRPAFWRIAFPSGLHVYPVNQVFRRYFEGAEKSLVDFGKALREYLEE